MENKKAFQSNANHPLADSLHLMMNKFEYVGGRVSSVRGRGQGEGPIQ